MAQNVTIAGNQYPSVPSILIPKTGGGGNATFTDTSPTTASASDVAQGKIFFDSTGTQQTGTASGGGGLSSWTKVAETSYQVNTTSTTATTIATWETGHSEIWTSNVFVYVRIRDTEGKRNGYFYGSDNFFSNTYPINNTTTTFYDNGIRDYIACSTTGKYALRPTSGTTFYGVCATQLYPDGSITIRVRYNSTYTLTINSTYKVEVYLLDPPTGAPIFT